MLKTIKIPDLLLVRFLRLTAAVTGIFSLVICILIIATYIQLKRTDPLNTPALAHLHEQLARDPGNTGLQQEIRQIDLLVRKAFFTSQWQIRTGGYLLAAGILLMIICMKALELITPKIPSLPGSEPTDYIEQRNTRKRWVVIAGIVLVSFTLVLAWLTHRMLNTASPEAALLEKAAAGADSIRQVRDNQNAPGSVLSDSSVLAKNEAPGNANPAGTFPTEQEILSNFTSFRGPGGNGVAFQKNIPVSWDGSSGKNIRWKTEIPLPGFNSPIIWKDKIFVSGAKENQRVVYCINASDGKITWTADLSRIPGSPGPAPKVNAETGQAAPTLTTDGFRIYAIFANGDLAALDMAGKITWSKSLGLPKNHYGYSSSLNMYQDLLIVQYDQAGSGKVMAFKGVSGKKAWETSRDVKISWASPVIVNTGSRSELLLASEPYVASYDPATGKELWKVDCISGEVGPSLAFGNGMVFSINEYSKLAAIKLGQSPSVAWEDNEYLSDVPSPVAIRDMVFVVTSYGVVVCYDAATGKKNWVKELDRSVYSSPMIADGKLFVMDKQGLMHIFRADKTMSIIGESPLGEGSVCTPAFADGRIFIRGNKNLFCIGK